MIELTSHPRRTTIEIVVGVAIVVTLLYLYWPAGVALGAAASALLVLQVGRDMQAVNAQVPSTGTDSLEIVPQGSADDDVRADLMALRTELGDDFADFAIAAKSVVANQYASIARLQRTLGGTQAEARHIMTVLEAQRFVGPPRGAKPREVLLGTEHLERLSRLIDEVGTGAEADSVDDIGVAAGTLRAQTA